MDEPTVFDPFSRNVVRFFASRDSELRLAAHEVRDFRRTGSRLRIQLSWRMIDDTK
jgi:hypothetical protein